MLRFFELLLDFSGERALCVLVKPYKKIPPWLEIDLVTPFKVLFIEKKMGHLISVKEDRYQTVFSETL